MKQEIAEQLLFESEATLRLVDSLLDELQELQPHLHDGHVGMHALQLDDEQVEPEEGDFPDRLSSAAGQARALLNALARSRSVLERTSLEKLPGGLDEARETPSAVEVRGGLERALLLVDRLEAESGGSAVQRLLRDEILEMIGGVRAQEITEQQLSYASSVLRETETQLSALVQRLVPPRADVIPFPLGRAAS